MMEDLYPLKFRPIFKEKIWGGQKLADVLGKHLPPNQKIGESWEISAVPGSISTVANGIHAGEKFDAIIAKYNAELIGEKVAKIYGKEFPLLIKFLDAQDDLSIQVHPGDDLARTRHNSFGKSEMWYILQSEADAKLNKGFNKNITPEEYLDSVQKNGLNDLLQNEVVSEEDVFYIPAGTIHNIGKGILLAEIQQSSDVTYRIHDFGRTDSSGKPRELHIQESVDALNYEKEDSFSIHPEIRMNDAVELVNSENFVTRRFTMTDSFDITYPKPNSFRIFICTKGEAIVRGNFDSVNLKKGETMLIPACILGIKIETSGLFEMLETQIP
jgi:mannose-6-phosphate isomerase